MWVKIVANNVTQTGQTLPSSERLPDGSWVTGFPGADPATILAAGWHQAPDPTAAPANGFTQTLVWTWNGTAASSAWVQGAAIPPTPPTAEQHLAAYKTVAAAAVTLTDLKEASSSWP